MKTLLSPDQAPVPHAGGGGGSHASKASHDASTVIYAMQCEFHDYPRAAIVDAMESCLLEIEGEIEPEALKSCMRTRLRNNDHPASAGAH